MRPWRELPFEVITDLFNSTSIEEQKSRIYKFVTTYYQVFNKDDMKRKFPNFPDHYYDYLSLAAQRRFDTLVKEEKKKWEIDRVDEMSPSGLRAPSSAQLTLFLGRNCVSKPVPMISRIQTRASCAPPPLPWGFGTGATAPRVQAAR